jgi:hypothetical protein
VRVVVLVSDLITASRIESVVTRDQGTVDRIESPDALGAFADADLLVVDWAAREPRWAETISTWRDDGPEPRPRVILFGPHTDLEAHAAARASGLGPMLARSALGGEVERVMRRRREAATD